MTDAHASNPLANIPIDLWIMVAALSAVAAVIVGWLSNANSRRNLDVQLMRAAQQAARQLKHNADQLTRQLAHDADQSAKQRAEEAAAQGKQLLHDAEQRDRDRQAAVRSGVCLDAAAALINLQTLLGRAANIDDDERSILDEFEDCQGKIAKVHVIGREATVHSVMAYMNELAPAMMEVLTRRTPLVNRKRAIDAHIALSQEALKERERFLAMLQQCSLEGPRDPVRWRSIDAQSRSADEQAAHHHGIASKLRIHQFQEQMEIGRRVVNLVAQIARVLPSAVLALRAEIESPLDLRRYQQLWDVQFGKVDHAWKLAIERLRSSAHQLSASKDAVTHGLPQSQPWDDRVG